MMPCIVASIQMCSENREGEAMFLGCRKYCGATASNRNKPARKQGRTARTARPCSRWRSHPFRGDDKSLDVDQRQRVSVGKSLRACQRLSLVFESRRREITRIRFVRAGGARHLELAVIMLDDEDVVRLPHGLTRLQFAKAAHASAS